MQEGGDDDGAVNPPGPPVHPDDRLWRHPSELQNRPAVPIERHRRPSAGAVLIYCSAATAIVAGLWWTSDQLDSPTVTDVAGGTLARATDTSLSSIRITDITWSSRLGVHCQASPRGVEVDTVKAGSAAARGGLLPGDLIMSMDGATIATVSDVSDVLELRDQGDRVRIRITRATAVLVLVVTLG